MPMKLEVLNEKIKIAIFDMDGTLVDSLPFFKILWKRVGERFFGDPDYSPPVYIDKKIRTTHVVESCRFIRSELSLDCTDEYFLQFLSEIMVKFYEEKAKLKTGVLEYIKYLKMRGVKLCVASASATEHIMINLNKYGISEYFDFVVSCVDVGYSKDRPDVYFAALEKSGEELSGACVFEDSYLALETAKKAGFMTVGIYDEGNYEHNRLRAASDFYIEDGMTFLNMICK